MAASVASTRSNASILKGLVPIPRKACQRSPCPRASIGIDGKGKHPIIITIGCSLPTGPTKPVELWSVGEGADARAHSHYANGVEVRLRFPDAEPQQGPKLGAIFVDDEQASALLDHPRRQGWELPNLGSGFECRLRRSASSVRSTFPQPL